MASLKDVANLSGVSITTVSRVLNSPSLVDPNTRQKVKSAMEKLDYRPNLLASGLRAKSSRLIGLIVPDVIHYTFASLAKYVSDYCQSFGYNVVVANHHDDPVLEAGLIDIFYRRNIDGIILSLVSDESHAFSLIRQSSVPTVIMDRLVRVNNQASISLDNYQAGYMAGEYLASLGHRQLACVTGPMSVRLSRERLKGFRQALLDRGIELRDRCIAEGDFYFESGVSAAANFFAGVPALEYPTAIWAQNDLMAAGILKHLSSLGLKVPSDISLIGMDDIALANMITPALTTISQPFRDFAEKSVDMILNYRDISTENTPNNIVLQPGLVVRESAAGPAR